MVHLLVHEMRVRKKMLGTFTAIKLQIYVFVPLAARH